MDNNIIINLELTVDETNVILFALSEKPYKDVFELIAKIREQAQPQTEKENEN